jgi:exopolyphosphatase/guanosine-5'-triphosphate,3'-diphosphate pyrophosphatase
MKKQKEKTAIIDLGSNSVRLIIILIQKGRHYKLIEQEKEMVRLGENLYEDNMLKEAAMERTMKTLGLFRDLIESHKAEKVILTATAAVRNADNRDVFLNRIKDEFNWNFQVVSGEREAFLGYLGVINTINENSFLIADIGGGSTEISLIQNRKLVESVSLNFGSVTLENKEIQLANKLEEITWLKNPGLPLVGLGGTIRSFAKIFKRNTSYPIDKLHNLEISYENSKKTIDIVTKKKSPELYKVNGLDKSRVDIIVPGLKILDAIIKTSKPEKLIISGNGLREGLFFEHLLSIILTQ